MLLTCRELRTDVFRKCSYISLIENASAHLSETRSTV